MDFFCLLEVNYGNIEFVYLKFLVIARRNFVVLLFLSELVYIFVGKKFIVLLYFIFIMWDRLGFIGIFIYFECSEIMLDMIDDFLFFELERVNNYLYFL